MGIRSSHPEDDLETGDVRSNEELTQAAAGGLRWIVYARIAVEVTLFGSMILLARLIPPSDFGIFAIVVIVQELAVTVPMEGIGSAMVQRRSITRDHLRGGMVMSIGVGLILTAVTLALAWLVVDPLMGNETAWLLSAASTYYLMGAVYAAPMAVLRRRLNFRALSIIDLALNASRAAASVALALAGYDAPALVFGSMAGTAFALVLALIFAPVPLPRWRPQAMRDLLPYGGPAALAAVSWTGFRNGDYAIIAGTLGTAAAGFYWRAYTLAVEYQKKIAAAMAQIAFPVLARTSGMEELLALRQRMVQLLAVVLYPVLALLLLLAPVAVPWLFGSEWEPAVVPTQILVLGGAATLAIDACGAALMAVGRARALLGYGVAHFLVYMAAVLAVAHLGLAAVAIAGSVVHTIFLGVAYKVLLRGLVPRPLLVLWHDLAPAMIGVGGLLLLAGPVDWGMASLHAPALIRMAAVCASGGVAYLMALRLIYPGSAHDLATAIRRLLPDRFSFGRVREPALAKP